jgi:ribosomal protein L32
LLNNSKDPTVGNYQTITTSWDQFYTLYLELIGEITKKKKNTKGFKIFPLQLKKPLKDQWYHIQHQVNKYCGYYAQVQQRMQSGVNNNVLVSQSAFFNPLLIFTDWHFFLSKDCQSQNSFQERNWQVFHFRPLLGNSQPVPKLEEASCQSKCTCKSVSLLLSQRQPDKATLVI